MPSRKKTLKASRKKKAAKKTVPKRKASRKSVKRAAGKSRSGRKSAKRAGTRTPDIYQAIVANTKDPILVLDQENIIQFVNAAAENFLDQSSDYLLGQKFGYSFNTSSPQEVNVVRSGHDYRIAEIVAHEMQGLDKRFYVINMRDVTEHMRSLERLRSLSNVDPLTGLLNRRGFIAAAQNSSVWPNGPSGRCF